MSADGNGTLLEASHVTKTFGGLVAVNDVSFSVPAKGIVSIIGPNGAGKSTTLRSISGLNAPKTGKIVYDGQDITGKPAHEVASMGIAQAPEGRRIFPRLTVRENLDMGAFLRSNRAEIERDRQRVYELFPRLKERENQKGGTMSGGEQQMLAMGRAMMANPKMLLLDEPSLGLAPVVVDRIYETIREINAQGVTILLVEQNANYALDVSARGYVLETGKVAISDDSTALRSNEDVQKAYLGT